MKAMRNSQENAADAPSQNEFEIFAYKTMGKRIAMILLRHIKHALNQKD